MFLNSPYSQLHGISVTNIFQIRPFLSFPRWTYIFTRSLNCFYSLPIFLIFHNCYISIHSLWDMDPCAGLHILAHRSILLPYLPNLCAVLRPAPLASYYFPLHSSPLVSPCIGVYLVPCLPFRIYIGLSGSLLPFSDLHRFIWFPASLLRSTYVYLVPCFLFQINKMHLCKPLIRAIDSLPIRDKFSLSQLITYKYYVGRKAMFDSDFQSGQSNLGWRKEWICSERPITICPIVTCWTHARSSR